MTEKSLALDIADTTDLQRIADGRAMLKAAVHRNKAGSREGVLERLFTFAFSNLVYAQIWEDPLVDMAAMQAGRDSRIVTIASGGCNVLSYLTARPREIVALDLNRAHVALTRLKLTAAQHLPAYGDFYRFFGAADLAANIKAYDRFVRPYLDVDSRNYWEKRSLLGRRRISLFKRGIYRHGLLGYFIGIAHLFARLKGVKFDALLNAATLEEQRAFFAAHLLPLFDDRFLRWATSGPVLLYGLGIPPAQFTALAGGQHMACVLRERLERLACDFPLRENYFAWQAFARRYQPEGMGPLPPYLQEANFLTVRKDAHKVRVLNQSYTEFLRGEPDASANCYVLLDAQDWMNDNQLNDLWRQITRTARPNARVIFRTAAAPSLLPGRVEDAVLARWHYHESESLAFSRQDRSSIYGGFHLYSLKG